MTTQIKAQVLDITPMEKRTYAGRTWYQRQFQCFIERKVAVHTLNAPDGDGENEVTARKVLNDYQPGFYMADLEVQQGDRGKLLFAVTKFTPTKATQ